MRKFALVIPALLCLTACATGQQRAYQTGVREPISLRDDGDACGTSLIGSFIGLRANGAVREEVATRSGAPVIRWIEPNMAVTQDFRADRLNATLDQDGVVTEFRCG